MMTGQFCKFARDDGACPVPCRHDGRCEARLETIGLVLFIDSLPLDRVRGFLSHPLSMLRAVASWRCMPERYGEWAITVNSVLPTMTERERFNRTQAVKASVQP